MIRIIGDEIPDNMPHYDWFNQPFELNHLPKGIPFTFTHPPSSGRSFHEIWGQGELVSSAAGMSVTIKLPPPRNESKIGDRIRFSHKMEKKMYHQSIRNKKMIARMLKKEFHPLMHVVCESKSDTHTTLSIKPLNF